MRKKVQFHEGCKAAGRGVERIWHTSCVQDSVVVDFCQKMILSSTQEQKKIDTTSSLELKRARGWFSIFSCMHTLFCSCRFLYLAKVDNKQQPNPAHTCKILSATASSLHEIALFCTLSPRKLLLGSICVIVTTKYLTFSKELHHD